MSRRPHFRRLSLGLAMLGIAFALAPARAGAQEIRMFFSGADLKDYCDKANPLCNGYIAAIADILMSSTGEAVGWRACLPKQLNVGVLRGKVSTWFEKNPDKLSKTAASLVANALADAYPCPPEKPGTASVRKP